MKHKRIKKKRKFRHRRWIEYLVINIFVFVSIGLLSLFVLNFSMFDPFTLAFKDFTLTDLYYTKIKNNDRIYNGPIVIIGIENKSREEIAHLLTYINQCNPKTIGIDIAFSGLKDSASDALLKDAIEATPNLILPYAASFDGLIDSLKNNQYFQNKANSFVNLIGDNAEFNTVRSYYPYYDNMPAFTSALINKYDSSLSLPLQKRNNRHTDIRYYGNLQNFRYYTFEEIFSPEFKPDSLAGKILLLGYIGANSKVTNTSLDEDRFYTPLNPRLSGRSHPDMYGVVIHANILRMALDKDYIADVPAWINWTLAFLLSWWLIPVFSKWFIHTPVWAHFYTKLVQLAISGVFVFFTVWAYPLFNVKIDSAAVLVSVLLLGDLILFYDALVKFLKRKLHLNFHSIFFEGSHAN